MKTFAVILALALVASCFAGDKKKEEKKSEDKKEEKKEKLGSEEAITNAFNQGLATGAALAANAAALGADGAVAGAKGSFAANFVSLTNRPSFIKRQLEAHSDAVAVDK